MRDFSEELADLARRVADAHKYLRIDDARARLVELEERGERARSLGRPRPRPQGHAEMARRARRRRADRRPRRPALRRADALHELGARGRRRVARAGDRRSERGACASDLDKLELRALFSGEHDERDAICEVHSGAGGTDAQDWAQMVLRMITRWAETKGFEVEVDEIARRPGGGHHVGDLHRQGALRVRDARR